MSPKLMIVGIDSSKDLLRQLVEIAETNRLSVIDVVSAYDQRNHTTSLNQQILPNLFFDIKENKITNQQKEKRPSDWKSVKERNKFFERRR